MYACQTLFVATYYTVLSYGYSSLTSHLNLIEDSNQNQQSAGVIMDICTHMILVNYLNVYLKIIYLASYLQTEQEIPSSMVLIAIVVCIVVILLIFGKLVS